MSSPIKLPKTRRRTWPASFLEAGLERLDLVRVEVEEASVPAVQIGPRVVLGYHGHVGLVVDVPVDAHDPGGPAVQEDVHGVGAPPRAQADAGALP